MTLTQYKRIIKNLPREELEPTEHSNNSTNSTDQKLEKPQIVKTRNKGRSQ